jgi:hypothetical protein
MRKYLFDKLVTIFVVILRFIISLYLKIKLIIAYMYIYVSRLFILFFNNIYVLWILQNLMRLVYSICLFFSYLSTGIFFVAIFFNYFFDVLKRYSFTYFFKLGGLYVCYGVIRILRKVWTSFRELIEEPPTLSVAIRGNSLNFYKEREVYINFENKLVLSYIYCLYSEKFVFSFYQYIFILLKIFFFNIFLIERNNVSEFKIEGFSIYSYYNNELSYIIRNGFVLFVTYFLCISFKTYRLDYAAYLYKIFPDTIKFMYYDYYPGVFVYWFSIFNFIIFYIYFIISRKIRYLDVYPEQSNEVEPMYDVDDSSSMPEYIVFISLFFYLIHWILCTLCLQGHILGFYIWWDNSDSILSWAPTIGPQIAPPSKWALAYMSVYKSIGKYIAHYVGTSYYAILLSFVGAASILDFSFTWFIDERGSWYFSDLIVETTSKNVATIFGSLQSLNFLKRIRYRTYNFWRVISDSYKYEVFYKVSSQKTRRLMEYDNYAWKNQLFLYNKNVTYLNVGNRVTEYWYKINGYVNNLSYLFEEDIPRDPYRWFDPKSPYYAQLLFDDDELTEEIGFYSPELEYEYTYPLDLYDDHILNTRIIFMNNFPIKRSVGRVKFVKIGFKTGVISIQRRVRKFGKLIVSNYCYYLIKDTELVPFYYKNNSFHVIEYKLNKKLSDNLTLLYVKEELYSDSNRNKVNKYTKLINQKNLVPQDKFMVHSTRSLMMLLRDLMIGRYDNTYIRW